MLFRMDEVAMMNEVGYEVTWLSYQSGYGEDVDMDQFVREVYANTGQKEHAEAVMSMVYAVVTLVTFPPLNVSKQTKRALKRLNNDSWCGHYVNDFIKRMNKEGRFFDDSFAPHKEALDLYHERKEYFKQILNHDERMSEICPAGKIVTPEEKKDDVRRFSLDEIVSYAKENLTVETAMPIQSMLYALMVEDGTKEEREKVVSITSHIINRNNFNLNLNKFEKPVGAVIQTGGRQDINDLA